MKGLLKNRYLLILLFFSVFLIASCFMQCGFLTYAEATYIKQNGENVDFANLNSAISSAPSGVETTFDICGTYEISKATQITIPSGKKIVFNILDATTFVRAVETDTNYNLFTINENATLTFKNDNLKTLVFDGNKTTFSTDELVSSSIFSNNGTLTINNAILQNNASKYGAGIRNLIQGVVTCNNVTIKNNNSYMGGAIFNNNVFNINFSDFVENCSILHGGAIYTERTTASGIINNCSFISNLNKGEQIDGKNLSSGGAICVYNGTLTVNSCSFSDNISELTNTDARAKNVGGAIGIAGGSLTINGTTEFVNNKAAQYGGAIGIYGGEVTISENVSASNNFAKFGGAVGICKGNLTINNLTFENNISTQYGGALYVSTPASSEVNVISATFSENKTNIEANGTDIKSLNSQDVYWKFEAENADYLTNNCFGGKILTENVNSIFTENTFPIAENFSLANGSALTFNHEASKIYVKEKLLTTNKLLLKPSSEATIAGVLLQFYDKNAVSENLFYFENEELKLVPENPNYLTFADGEVVNFVVSIEYKIKFYDYLGGNLLGEVSVKYGDNISAPPSTPTRDGYRFDGWNKPLENITSSDPIYGVWTELFTVIFYDIDGTTQLKTLSNIPSGEKISSAEFPDSSTFTNFDEENYNYVWLINKEENIEFDVNSVITTNVSLFLSYIPKNVQVKFIYDDKPEEVFDVPYSTSFASSFTLPEITEKVGYSVRYWALESGERFNESEIITQPITLYEKHVLDTFEIQFVLKYFNGGTIVKTEETLFSELKGYEIDYGNIVDTFPAVNGVEFSQKLNLQWDYDNSPITADRTIVGTVDINEYDVVFKADGKIIDTKTGIRHGSKILLADCKEIPAKVGYDVVKPVWNFDFNSAITKNLIIQAKYTINVYTITFETPEGVKTRTVNYGETVNTADLIKQNFGEIIKYSHDLNNITSDLTIKVWKVNVLMWVLIGLGILFLILIILIIIKIVRKKKLNNKARRSGKVEPYL